MELNFFQIILKISVEVKGIIHLLTDTITRWHN